MTKRNIMKAIFMLTFLLALCSCSVAKETESNNLNLTDKTVDKDTTIAPHPAMLNGKVITPSQNNTTISPNSSKQEKK